MSSGNPFYKICIVGDSGVGKTTLLYQYLERRFNPKIKSTIGSEFFVKYLDIPELNKYVTLQIWDLGGQYFYKYVRLAFYKGTKGIIYVYDLVRRETFDNILDWKQEIEASIGTVPSVLVGNKSDLIPTDNRLITRQETDFIKDKITASKNFETSAKLGTGVEQIFINLTKEMYRTYHQ